MYESMKCKKMIIYLNFWVSTSYTFEMFVPLKKMTDQAHCIIPGCRFVPLKLTALADNQNSWESFHDLDQIFVTKKTKAYGMFIMSSWTSFGQNVVYVSF